MHDIAIVGAGIFGLSASLSLRARGYQVTLIDAGPVPHPLASSTDISKVVRIDYGDDELYTALAEKAREGWLRWNQELGDELYHEEGVTMLTQTPMTPGEFTHDSYQLLRRRGHPLQRLQRREIARRLPSWNAERYMDGYYNPRSGYAESGRVVSALARRALEQGIAMQTGQAVQALLEENGRVVGVRLQDGRSIKANTVIVAAGTWTPWLLPELKGAMRTVGLPVFHVRPSDPDLFRPPHFYTFSADVSRTGWYGFSLHPREGVIKIAYHGPGRELHPVNDPRQVSDSEIKALGAFLNETLPPLRDAPLVYTRLCLYCDVPDGHFWIDNHPHKQGLVVAGGGSGHAFKFAPVLGDLIADAVEEQENPFLHRFRWRTFHQDVVGQEATRFYGADINQ